MPSWSSSASANTGASATTTSATASTGRSARCIAIRHRPRSDSRSSDCRNQLPVPRTRLGIGGTRASSQRLAAARSHRTSRRHAAAAASSSGRPIPATLSAAPRISSTTAGIASSVTGSVVTRYATACPARTNRRSSSQRRDHDWPSTETSPGPAQHLHGVGRVRARRQPAHALAAGRALGVEVVAAGREHGVDRARAGAQRQPRRRARGFDGDVAAARARVERVAAVAGDVDRAAAGRDPRRPAVAAQRHAARRSCGCRARRCRARPPGGRRCTARAASSGSARARRNAAPSTRVLDLRPVAEREALGALDLDGVPPAAADDRRCRRRRRRSVRPSTRAVDRVDDDAAARSTRTPRPRARPLRPPPGGPRLPRHGPTATNASGPS